MKNLIFVAFLGAASLSSTPANAIPIIDASELSPSDEAEISKAEQAFFDMLVSDGIEKTLVHLAGDGGELTPEARNQMAVADKLCGKLFEVQKSSQRHRGNRFAQRIYVTAHENCVLFWELDFVRVGKNWDVKHFNFDTDEGALKSR